MSEFQQSGLSIYASDPLVKSSRDKVGVSLVATSYSQIIKAVGGYWSSDMTLRANQQIFNDWLQNGLGNHIETFNPAQNLIWEGFVNEITATFGGLQLTLGPLIGGEMGNKVKTVYSTIDTSVDPPVLGIRTDTDWASNTDSQTKYGIIEKVISLSGATDTEAEQARDSYLTYKAFPEVSRQSTIGGKEPSIKLKCLGYWHWLKAYIYNTTGTGTENLSAKIENILAAENNSLFSTDYTKITANTTQQRSQEDNDKTAETLIADMIALGDASFNTYKAGFYANRRFYYEQIPTTIKYEQKLASNQGLTEQGKRFAPWDIKAGEWLLYTDLLVGRNPPLTNDTLRSDPRACYIDTVKFSIPYDLSINGKEVTAYEQLVKRLGSAAV